MINQCVAWAQRVIAALREAYRFSSQAGEAVAEYSPVQSQPRAAEQAIGDTKRIETSHVTESVMFVSSQPGMCFPWEGTDGGGKGPRRIVMLCISKPHARYRRPCLHCDRRNEADIV